MLQKTLEIYRVSEKLPESIWDEHTPNYSKHCLVWDDMLKPSLAYYDRKDNKWYCDDKLILFNFVFNIIYWAEIPENVNTEMAHSHLFKDEVYDSTHVLMYYVGESKRCPRF